MITLSTRAALLVLAIVVTGVVIAVVVFMDSSPGPETTSPDVVTTSVAPTSRPSAVPADEAPAGVGVPPPVTFTPPRPPAPQASPQSYLVRRGDCLWDLAWKFYGNHRYQPIATANHLANPDLIYPRQKLVIP